MSSAQELKNAGNAAFTAGNFDSAIELFTKAIEVEDNYVFYSNRSGAHASKQDWSAALADAEACIARNPSWGKGYSRKSTALVGQGALADAAAALNAGIKADPSNASLTEALADVNARIQQQQQQRAGAANPLAGMINLAKLASNPKTAKYLSDPSFIAAIKDIQTNPSALQKHMGDPRVMEAISVSLGIDMAAMPDDDADAAAAAGNNYKFKGMGDDSDDDAVVGDASDDEDAHKSKPKAKAATEANKTTRAPAGPAYSAPAPAAAAPPVEEQEEPQEVDEELEAERRERAAKRAAADALKEQGTTKYKAKDFAAARALYLQAVETDDTNAAYLSNLAAVAVEEKAWDEAVDWCDKALAVAAVHKVDSAQKARIYLRKANALTKVNKWADAIAAYKWSILEENSGAARDALRKAESAKRAYETQAYLDPVKSEEEKEAGNEFFKAGDFPAAVAKYTEALKRNPDNYKVYANRAACYIKLMDWGKGLDDCDKCLAADPKFVKAYIRKAKIQHFLKRYPQALDTYRDGLKLEPTNEDLLEGLRATQYAISAANASGEVDQQRREESMKDPEVQKIMRDPVMNQILQDMQDHPEKAQEHLKDAKVMQAIEKLAAAGIIRLG